MKIPDDRRPLLASRQLRMHLIDLQDKGCDHLKGDSAGGDLGRRIVV